jgi:putative spermidine/putrescine transport system ATP-binding protein
LVNRPRVLLLDEPLGALDLKLREQMQVELKAIQREVGITFVFVTHDQDEALTLSDRIAVFNNGRIEQVGTAAAIYEQPTSAFVAGFVGTSNLLRGEASRALFGREGSNSIRPEKLRLLPIGGAARDGERHADGRIAEVVYAGPITRFVIDLPAGTRLIALRQNDSTSSADVATMRGTGIRLAWRDEHVVSVPEENAPDEDQEATLGS